LGANLDHGGLKERHNAWHACAALSFIRLFASWRAEEALAVAEYIANGTAFTKGCGFAAWLGLVAEADVDRRSDNSGTISKRSNGYLDTLAGRPCHTKKSRDKALGGRLET
jgi:hypothetical protein